MSGGTTTVTVSVETWKELNRRKDPGESFDSVIQDLIECCEADT
jgi:predicted CopG family antitoxin